MSAPAALSDGCAAILDTTISPPTMLSDDGSSSPLSSPPSSVPSSPLSSPPPSLPSLDEMRPYLTHAYPSPPSSQQTSHSGSPLGDHGMDSNQATDAEGPPAKRRRISREPKERSTQHLDLRNGLIHDDHAQFQLDRVMRVLHKRRKIVVIAGAGMSVSAGIPDFRSSTGLFKSLKEEHKLKGSGKHLFDASVYKDDSSTSSFHTMVSSMSRMTKDAKPTVFHHMLATLANENRLLRLYSQNVDGIDTGLEPLKTTVPLRKDDTGKWPRTIQLHGGLDNMVCSKCGQLSAFDASLFEGPVPPTCPACEEVNDIRTNHQGKRSHGIGRLRPRMVLYNEHNPDDEAIGSVTRDDLRKRPDAVIVVGTTLKVPGVRRIVREMCGVVRDHRDGVAIWINNDLPPVAKDLENCFDIVVQGGCDEIATRAAMRKWFEPAESDECSEVSEENAKKATLVKAEVQIPVIKPTELVHAYLVDLPSSRHLNNSFPAPVEPMTPKKTVEKGPQPSPMTIRKASSTSFVEQETVIVSGLLTPSKVQKHTSLPPPSVPSINDKLKQAAPVKKRPGRPPKAAKDKAAPKATQAKTTKAARPRKRKAEGPPTPYLKNAFNTTKGISAPSQKKNTKKHGPSRPASPSKLRQVLNASGPDLAPAPIDPLKSLGVFSSVTIENNDTEGQIPECTT